MANDPRPSSYAFMNPVVLWTDLGMRALDVFASTQNVELVSRAWQNWFDAMGRVSRFAIRQPAMPGAMTNLPAAAVATAAASVAPAAAEAAESPAARSAAAEESGKPRSRAAAAGKARKPAASAAERPRAATDKHKPAARPARKRAASPNPRSASKRSSS